MFTDVSPMVTDVYPMVTGVYPMVAEESSVANPQKIDENIRKMQKNWLATLYLPRNYPIPRYYRYSSVSSTDYGVLSVASV
jgi:hypothetical protein